MKKFLSLFLFSTLAFAQGDPAPYVKGQKSTGLGNQASTIFVPSNQSTKINAYQALLETGNPNMLVNPELEGSVSSGWTCTTGTCTKTTTSGEFSSGLAAMKIVPAANVLNVSQSVNTPAGIQAQGYARILYRAPATCSTSFVIRTLVNGSTQSEVPTSRLVFDDKFHEIEIPLVFSTTSAGIQVFASGTCTGNIFIDNVILAQGLGTQNLMLDNTYSAQISSAGTVSLENTDWISGNCTNANPTVCTVKSGLVSSAMNCTVTPITPNDRLATIDVNAGDFSVWTKDSTGAASSTAVKVICQKSGNDYLNSSANVYSQASGSIYALYTGSPPTGTLNSSYNAVSFGNKILDSSNAYSGGTYTVPESGVYTIESDLTVSGTFAINQYVALAIYVNGSVAYEKFTYAGGLMNALTGVISTPVISLTKGDLVVIRVATNSTSPSFSGSANFNRFSIAKNSSGIIIGSFAGVPAVPGYQGRVDTFSVSYGTTNTITFCSSTPCLIDQIGNAVSSITRSSAGIYTLNTTATYLKLKCVGNSIGSNYTVTSPAECRNCSSRTFNTVITSTSALTDTYGTLHCQGAR